MIDPRILGSILSLGFAATITTIVFCNRNRNNSKKQPDESNKAVINDVLFFPDNEFPCTTLVDQLSVYPKGRRVTCYNQACRKLHGRPHESTSSLLKFLTYLSEAKHKVDICIFVFTQFTIANILENLVKAGVHVRVITDAGEDEATGNQVEKLRRCGIVIKSNKRQTGALMHHKFVIIDDEMLLVGSFNWTNKAVVSNYEAVLATTEKTLVQPFVLKFDEMWSQFNVHPTNTRNGWN